MKENPMKVLLAAAGLVFATMDTGAPLPALVTTPPDWERCDPFPSLKPERSFVNDDRPNDRLRVAYFRAGGEKALYARAWFGPGAEGPPGFAHGGAVARRCARRPGRNAGRAGSL